MSPLWRPGQVLALLGIAAAAVHTQTLTKLEPLDFAQVQKS